MHFSEIQGFAHQTLRYKWFYVFFEFQPNAKKAKTTADPQRKCIF